MELLEAMAARHSVRAYTDRRIEGDAEQALRAAVDECNRQSGLHIQLFLNEPRAFDSRMARYGRFQNVNNYIALVGPKNAALDELCGYYGEKLVLLATRLGLHSCWVAATYSKGKCAAVVSGGEKLLMVISLGYGVTDGAAHKSKPPEALGRAEGVWPDWFKNGVEAARLAPTAMNQQKFLFLFDGNRVEARALSGFHTKVDLGIAKYHFELGAGPTGWSWK